MLMIIFMFSMLGLACKLCLFAMKAAWEITKLFSKVLFLPIILIGLVCVCLVHLAVPMILLFAFGGLFILLKNHAD